MSKLSPALISAHAELLSLHAAERLDRLITLACIRQFFDAEMPNTAIGGRDPRTSVSLGMQSWPGVLVENEDRALLLDVTVARFNELLGDDLLAGGWQDLDAGVVREALEHISRWRPTPSCGGDALGELLQAVRGPGNGAGDFYTPYNACLLMASLNPVKPGETVLDPCCGSGRMLLAAVEVCRKLHGHDQVPNRYPTDVDVAYNIDEYRALASRLSETADRYRAAKQSMDFPFHGGRRSQRPV